MPIGKDSITKRVAKQTETAPKTEAKATVEKNIAPELVATTAAAPAKKAPAKKTSTTATTAKKTTTTKKAAPKKTAAEKLTPPEEKKVDTAVISNVAPETVEAVIGHKEKEAVEIVQIGGKMPTHLL